VSHVRERASRMGRSPPLTDDGLLDLVQRQTFRYFWEGAHPTSGLARDRCGVHGVQKGDAVAVGGSGFGVMAIIVAASREWINRQEALARVALMLDLLERATCYTPTHWIGEKVNDGGLPAAENWIRLRV
jgi:hypothetical protein